MFIIIMYGSDMVIKQTLLDTNLSVFLSIMGIYQVLSKYFLLWVSISRTLSLHL